MRLVDTSAWIEWLIGSPTGVGVAPLDPPTAILAPEVCRRHGLATADAVIYATTRSRCQPSDRFVVAVSSNGMARTGPAGPSITAAARAPITPSARR